MNGDGIWAPGCLLLPLDAVETMAASVATGSRTGVVSASRITVSRTNYSPGSTMQNIETHQYACS